MANGYISSNQETGEQKVIVIYTDGSVTSIPSSHPRYDEIVELVKDRADDDTIRDLTTSLERDLNQRFVELTDRVKVQNGEIYVDGALAHDAITEHILHMLDNGDNEYIRVVRFYENLSQNPSRRSREQLFGWLQSVGLFQLSEEGHVLGYKGVSSDGKSIHAGGANVNGQWVDGRVPYEVGSFVTMERAQVQDDPSIACSHGLHIGTWDYAVSFGRMWESMSNFGSKILTVSFNPADVVSVPNHDTRKLRTCALKVEAIVDNPVPPSTRFASSHDDANDTKLDDDSQVW